MKIDKQRYVTEHEDAVRIAMHEWKEAVAYFENVKDPELIDYAAYRIETARRRYEYLLKRRGG